MVPFLIGGGVRAGCEGVAYYLKFYKSPRVNETSESRRSYNSKVFRNWEFAPTAISLAASLVAGFIPEFTNVDTLFAGSNAVSLILMAKNYYNSRDVV